jgi:hypothetical protein
MKEVKAHWKNKQKQLLDIDREQLKLQKKRENYF